MKDYSYENNMHIIDHILNELMITRTIEEIEEFKKAKILVFLKMFPCVNPQADAIEEMFDKYCADFNVREWYESLFKIKLEKIGI